MRSILFAALSFLAPVIFAINLFWGRSVYVFFIYVVILFFLLRELTDDLPEMQRRLWAMKAWVVGVCVYLLYLIIRGFTSQSSVVTSGDMPSGFSVLEGIRAADFSIIVPVLVLASIGLLVTFAFGMGLSRKSQPISLQLCGYALMTNLILAASFILLQDIIVFIPVLVFVLFLIALIVFHIGLGAYHLKRGGF